CVYGRLGGGNIPLYLLFCRRSGIRKYGGLVSQQFRQKGGGLPQLFHGGGLEQVREYRSGKSIGKNRHPQRVGTGQKNGNRNGLTPITIPGPGHGGNKNRRIGRGLCQLSQPVKTCRSISDTANSRSKRLHVNRL